MLPIQKLFIKYNFSARKEKVKYIVIHDVGAVSTAINNRTYFNGGNRNASADFFIDANNIIQCVDYAKNYSWAVGSGNYGISNSNSLSVEMCLEPNLKPTTKTISNTLDLVQKLMKELNIPLNNVVRHYDASRKICPKSFSSNNWALWGEFKRQLVAEPVKAAKINADTLYRVMAGSYSVRTNADNQVEKLKSMGIDATVMIFNK